MTGFSKSGAVVFMRPTTLVAFLMVLAAMQAFAEDRCAGNAPEAESWVAEKLNEAQAAREKNEFDSASEHLNAAALNFPRIADVSIPSRCMGQKNWRRYYKEKQLTYFELGRSAENTGKKKGSNFDGFWYYVEGDNRKDVVRLLSNLPNDPLRYASAGNLIRDKLSGLQWAVDNGFMLLADEQAGQGFYQTRLDRLIAHSRSRGSTLLKAESDIVSGDITENEEIVMKAEQDATAMLGAIMGDDSVLPASEARHDVTRAKRSLTVMGEARQWLQWVTTEEATPILVLAVERGDVLLARADDTSHGLEARDDYYAAAIRYYKFADADIQAMRAISSRKAIEPELAAARLSREARMDEKAAQLQESVQEFQQSIEKSDAEKKSFRSEADALEDELDF
jgi:hypothetical protein